MSKWIIKISVGCIALLLTGVAESQAGSTTTIQGFFETSVDAGGFFDATAAGPGSRGVSGGNSWQATTGNPNNTILGDALGTGSAGITVQTASFGVPGWTQTAQAGMLISQIRNPGNNGAYVIHGSVESTATWQDILALREVEWVKK